MALPDDDLPSALNDDLVADLAEFDDLLQNNDDLPELVARLSQTQHLLHQLGRAGKRAASAKQTTVGSSADTELDNREFDAPPPRRVGKFRLVRELGRGGCGIVYLAHDERLDRHVALKLPQPGVLLDDAARDRFVREAKAAASLDHRHIVPVLEAGEDGYLCYIASVYCDGPTLAEWLRELDESPPIKTVARIAAELAQAAAHAHARGVMHRDIKPGNVLMVRNTEQPAESGDASSAESVPNTTPDSSHADLIPKLTDFGLAKVALDDHSQTRTGQMIGTAAYMAPEQVSAAGTVDATADVYSLGVVLYELLTGRPVFQGDGHFETMELARRDDPVPPSRLRAGIPRDLETICLKCLAKSPTKRYPDGRALADDLSRFLNGQPIHARRAGMLERAWRWCARRPIVAALSALLMLSVAVLLIGFATAAIVFRDAERQQSAARDLAEHRLFDALLTRVGKERLGNRPGRRFDALQSVADASKLFPRLSLGEDKRLALRNEAIACMALVDLKRDVTWSAYPRGSDVTGIAVDAAVERYAMFEKGAIVVRRLGDNHVIARITDLGQDDMPETFRAFLRFSADGKLIASVGAQATFKYRAIPTRVWEIATQRVLLSLPAEGPWQSDRLDISPDSQTCAIAGLDGTVRMFDLSGHRKPRTISSGLPAHTIRFNPTGSQLAISRPSPMIEIVDAATGREVTRIQPNKTVRCLAWNADGDQLAYGDGDRAYLVYPANGRFYPLIGHQGEVTSMAFHPQGHLLATAGYDGKTRLWDSRTAQSLLVADGNAIRFSDDGTRLAFGAIGHEVGRWNVAAASECRTLGQLQLAKDRMLVDFHPNERLLAVAAQTGPLLFDVATGKQIARIETNLPQLARFLPPNNDVLVVTPDSAIRWPVQSTNTGPNLNVTIGKPQLVKTPKVRFGNVQLTADRTSLLVEVEEPAKGAVIPVATGQTRWVDYAVWCQALSPNGQWLVVTFWHGQSLLLNARDLSKVQSLPGQRARPVFSPDGRWLVLGTGADFWIVDTNNWKTVRHIQRKSSGVGLASAAFTVDGRSLGITDNQGSITLLRSETWEPLATFIPPAPVMISSFCFSRQTRKLAASTTDGRVFVWDLFRIRGALAKLQLDW